MNGGSITVVVDNGELIEIANDCLEEMRFEHEYLEYQRELLEINNSITLAVLVFIGACLGALIFRHLRK